MAWSAGKDSFGMGLRGSLLPTLAGALLAMAAGSLPAGAQELRVWIDGWGAVPPAAAAGAAGAAMPDSDAVAEPAGAVAGS